MRKPHLFFVIVLVYSLFAFGCQKDGNPKAKKRLGKPNKTKTVSQRPKVKVPRVQVKIDNNKINEAFRQRLSSHNVDLQKAKQAATNSNAFGIQLLQQLAKKNQTKNVFLSPYSLSTALAMTMVGAGGDTLKEMKKTLAVPGNANEHHQGLFELSSWLYQSKSQYKYQLEVANRIWVERTTPPQAVFVNTVKRHYGPGFQQADFIQNFREEHKKINSWANKQTQGMIPELLPSGALSPSTRMVLTNAIFFKGNWKYKFKTKYTKKRTFYGPSDKTKIMTMYQQGKFMHAYIKGGHVLELPYQHGKTSMVVFLPYKSNKNWRSTWLSPSLLSRALKKMRKKKVKVFLPRMKLKTGYKLKPNLKAMGMQSAFLKRANFRKMLVPNGLTTDVKIKDVFHKGALEVDEKGTKAAAATAVVMKTKRSMRKPKVVVFRVNRPFLLLLRERKTNTYLFAGCITNPNG